MNRALKVVFESFKLEFENLKLMNELTVSGSDLQRISAVSHALSEEFDFSRLIDLILMSAREIASSDGGSVYVVEPAAEDRPSRLRFMKSVLDLSGEEFFLPIDENSIAGYVALKKETLNIEDVYNLPSNLPFSFNPDYDQAHNYYTKSMLVIPMVNHLDEIIGVIQLINRKKDFFKKLTVEEMKSGEVISFSSKDANLVRAMAGQAAVAVNNQRLMQSQRKLLESFIQLIAGAIDAKSPYTGGHCNRVPVLTEMLTKAVCKDKTKFSSFTLSEEEWYELRIAAYLHDCGKVVTPVHVMDKATKLETIFDRIETVRARFEVRRQNAQTEYYKSIAEGLSEDAASQSLKSALAQIDDDQAFIETVNIGGETLSDEAIARIEEIGNAEFLMSGKKGTFLSENEIKNLSIRRGTLTSEERIIINRHMVETVKMLEALPFPKNLKNVPEYAGGHHETMDGSGYPKGIYAGDMSIPARIMAIADVFEALTALDRPYKKGKTLSETMSIMGKMKENNHLDPDLFDIFVQSKVYLEYGEKYMPQRLIDEVDEAALLNIVPKSFELPAKAVRDKRWEGFLEMYQDQPSEA